MEQRTNEKSRLVTSVEARDLIEVAVKAMVADARRWEPEGDHQWYPMESRFKAALAALSEAGYSIIRTDPQKDPTPCYRSKGSDRGDDSSRHSLPEEITALLSVKQDHSLRGRTDDWSCLCGWDLGLWNQTAWDHHYAGAQLAALVVLRGDPQ